MRGSFHIPGSADEVADKAIVFLKGYGENITAFMIGLAKGAVNIVIGAVLAIYLLSAKATLKKDCKILLSALLMDDKLNSLLYFARRCNFILNRYLVFTLLDALIVGAIFDFSYRESVLPYLQKRKAKKQAAADEEHQE